VPRSGSITYSVVPDEAKNLPALILMHGAGAASQQWPYRLRRLPGWQVFSPDLPGHGRSGGQVERKIEGYAARVLEWMEAVSIERAVLVGHSMGAAIALAMAIQAGEKVRGLILLGAAARFPVNPMLLEKLSVPLWAQEGVNLIVKWSFSKGADQRLRQDYFKQLIANQAGVVHNDFAACSVFDVTARLSEIRQPVWLLCGEEDVMVPLRLSQELAGAIPKAKLRLLSHCGHMFFQEHAAETAAAIEENLQTLRLTKSD